MHSLSRPRSLSRWAPLVGVALVVAACSAGSDPGSSTIQSSPDSTSGSPPESQPESSATCETLDGGVAWDPQESTQLVEITKAGSLTVYAAEYPLPGPTEGLWSQWGQGVVAGGVHYSAVGDHLGADGNSYFFSYDPGPRQLTRFMDVESVVEVPEGTWGFGKIHAQMAADDCGRVWAATYWGTRRDIENFEGDHLLSIDPSNETVIDLGVIEEGKGLPSMTMSADGSELVFEAVDPEADTGMLVAWDLSSLGRVSEHEDEDHTGFRALGVAAGGSILYSVWDGQLRGWETSSDVVATVTQDLPGEWMRAATTSSEEGVLYGVTDDEPRLFSLDESGLVEDLGDPGGYTTSLALDESGRALYWMPEAHGGAWELGAPVMKLDLQTGEISEVLTLRGSFEGELGLLPGGTYSMVYGEGRLYIGVNASPLEDDSGFGTVVLVVVEGL